MEIALYLKVITEQGDDFGVKISIGETQEDVPYSEIVKLFDKDKFVSEKLIPLDIDYIVEVITKEEYEQNYECREELDV